MAALGFFCLSFSKEKFIFFKGAFFEDHLKDYHRKMNDSQTFETERVLNEMRSMQKNKDLELLEAELAKVNKAK